jgi:hypothetical protein
LRLLRFWRPFCSRHWLSQYGSPAEVFAICDLDKANVTDPRVGWWSDLPYVPVHGNTRNQLFDWQVAAVRNGLGTLGSSVSQYIDAYVRGINDSHQVVGWCDVCAGTERAFVGTKGGLTNLGGSTNNAWLTFTNLAGNGATARVTDPAATKQRNYRVVAH